MSRVAALDGVVFLRNGGEHAPSDAAAHMRRKREAAGDRVRTAEEFIDACASASSVSGEAYTLRWSDGREMTSRDFLLQLLREIDGGR
ncbi:MAG: hypothetical protein FJ253_05625 [Phycisphaerae bacterium]|nr:hypothetical protein [Phycisphaerae bacterium]